MWFDEAKEVIEGLLRRAEEIAPAAANGPKDVLPELLAAHVFFLDYEEWASAEFPTPQQAELQDRLRRALSTRASRALFEEAERYREERREQYTDSWDLMGGRTDEVCWMAPLAAACRREGLDADAFGRACLRWSSRAPRFCFQSTRLSFLEICRAHVEDSDVGPWLSMDEWGLATLPPEIGELTELRGLSVWDAAPSSALREIPPELGKLSDLVLLRLRAPLIWTLPSDLAGLVSLETLDLSAMRSELPQVVFQLRSLRSLTVREGWPRWTAERFPEAIGDLTELRELVIDAQSLRSLPGSLERLASLERLELCAGEIQHLPPGLSRLTRLRTLEVSSWAGPALPACLWEMPFLESLTVQAAHQKPIAPGQIESLRRALPTTRLRVT